MDIFVLKLTLYSVSSSKSYVVKIFQKGVRGKRKKRCSISIENNLVDHNAVNLREGKYLFTSLESLEVNIVCGQVTKSHKVKAPIYILSLGQGCSGFHGSLLLPPYYSR